MRLVFAGTPEFAAVSLRALLQRGHEVVSVLTQPDRPAGRGLRHTQSPVKVLALEHGIAVQQPATLRDAEMLARLQALAAEAWVVAAYGLLLPRAVLDMPRRGCLNVHASLLPRWRGAAPIQRALMAGDDETGISIMQMDEGLDTGRVYLHRAVPIRPDDNAGSLHDRLAEVGAEAICEVLDGLTANAIAAVPQPAEGASYARKLSREDACIDWNRPAADIERLLRALDPAPGAFTRRGRDELKLWSGRVRPGDRTQAPGTVLALGPDGIEVQCGDGALLVTTLQRAGSRRLDAGVFLRGYRIDVGERFGA